MINKRSLLWLVIAVALISSSLVWRRHPTPPVREAPTAPAPTASAVAAPTPASPTAAKTRRLSPEERKQLGAQIAAGVHKARQARAAQARAAGTAVVDEDPIIPLEAVGPELKDALTAAIPILAECFKQAGITDPKTAVARMTMTSEPDLGTVIDTADIVGPDGAQLGAQLDSCLRDSIDSLALPPLGQPGKLQLQYSFRFD